MYDVNEVRGELTRAFERRNRHPASREVGRYDTRRWVRIYMEILIAMGLTDYYRMMGGWDGPSYTRKHARVR